jgi:CBS domain-containing protein
LSDACPITPRPNKAGRAATIIGDGRRDGMDLTRNLKVDSVSRLRPTPPRCIDPAGTVADAVALMRKERVGCLLVCQGGRLLGIFTERDLTRRVLAVGEALTRPVSAFMTPDPVVVHRKESVGSAVRRMQEGGYRHLPVVDEAGRPEGVLSVKRIVHYLAEHFPATVYNLPPDPGVVPQTPEGA